MLCSTALDKTARHNVIRDILNKYSRAFDDRMAVEPVLERTEQGMQRRGDLRVHKLMRWGRSAEQRGTSCEGSFVVPDTRLVVSDIMPPFALPVVKSRSPP
ncbi:hypothetical protein FVE85_8901 [Porphyridium purpureum]|uniref:Uncharacterized protein n=1 Tax=Porphyridium purpureum TaxID=35688 RepID=A0A5J4YQA1_PORPP|nr:hypothetical protein FVE85_8901 [Porphyridium purpureum]|eukprot:POR4454..scf296_7